MSKRFGRKRGPDCKCNSNFTCRECLIAGMLLDGETQPKKPIVRELPPSTAGLRNKGA